ncbi:ATP-binding protein [Pseudomonas otitidis]|uniref:P-loop ATPase, Sll1717 family n=1 Tax=Metapseudomonas otitidis TaxID=319939 RepID=UPI00244A6E2F|nr:ATP-binding protein [Pseudomonas otitidis]MDH1107210.1 ATP-binding protein [Pseudomonas otitidis]MDH1161022.1 ATP-binding protein [Pseudomonas otitidis]MDH1162813.1 ATP-binding protein [Pseudomonas otitidis]
MRGNVLGDIRAEHDSEMLESSFWETSDYKSLLESNDRSIVVGRRGTGKSALVHMLSKHWSQKPKTKVMIISPEEEQIIGLRDTFELFGEKYLHIKAGTKMAWRYGIYMEIITDLSNHYKYQKNIDIASIAHHVQAWGSRRQSISTKIRKKLKEILRTEQTPQSRIAELSDILELDLIEEVLFEALEKSDIQYVIFADKLDEGYSPDDLGVAIVDGFVQAAIDIKSRSKELVIAFAFVRDNIYRAISKLDPDFTRNIEGQTLRLHWDEYNLFNLICNRIRIAFDCKIENNTRVWNQFSANELKGKEGFRIPLKLTLYRPRDILVLLNDAFLRANSHDRKEIVLDDIESTAKTISSNRLNDLHKEYESIFPALEEFTRCFNGSRPELTIEETLLKVENILNIDRIDKNKLQDIFLFENGIQVLQRLYSVGFLGIYNEQSASFVFCHDGKEPDRDFVAKARLLIHPCYWLALGTSQAEISLGEAEQIHDEYDIEVSSVSTEQRNQRIGALLQELADIPEGKPGAVEFEAWCLKAIKIIFAGSLCNVEIHPNKNGLQQRDIIGTNLAETKFWKRIHEDYQSRQIIFEVKNFRELSATEYRQVNSYLCNDYGRIAFIITRDFNNNLSKDKELNWAKELFNNHKKLVVKLSVKFLEKHLRKARSPQKHDALDKELNNLLDTYARQYLITKAK